MRQVFTSPRLENVERVAALLKEQGVEARISNGRSYRGTRRGNFSYRESANEGRQPAVWIVKSEDQPKARQLLREIGLLDSGRSPTSYLPTSIVDSLREDDAGAASRKRMFRIKSALLIGIVVALGLGLLALRDPAPTGTAKPSGAAAPAAPAPAEAATAEAPGVGTAASLATYVMPTPSALAAMLIDAELRAHAGAVCVSVDGADAPEAALAQLRPADRARLRPRTDCATAAGTASALTVAVGEYRTDGSGTGTVQVRITDTGDDGAPRIQTRTLDVQRDDLQWRIRRVAM